MNSAPPVVIAGGGTGGHLFPGVALADELARRGMAITFVGTARGIEARVIPQTPYALELIDVAGLKGQGLTATLRSLLRLPLALLHAWRLLRRIRPRLVVGVGGYASGPLVLVAALCRIPTVILEQNSIPGITNKILARFVRSVVIAFPEAATFFPAAKVHPLGNPIRAAIAQLATTTAPARPAAAAAAAPPIRVLVLGGSQGATAVNDLFVNALEAAEKTASAALRDRIRVHHQTGAKDRDRIEARYRTLAWSADQARVSDFITDMGAAYTDCDLVVGRAGATTLAELTAIGRPALLIPFPQAADDHQTHNARWMVATGAAELLPQATTAPADLAARLLALCGAGSADDRTRLARMADASAALGRPDAARAIADHVQALAALAAPPAKDPQQSAKDP